MQESQLILEMRSEAFQHLRTELNNYTLIRAWEGEYCIHLNCGRTSEAEMEVNGMESGSQKTIYKTFNDQTGLRLFILCPIQKDISRKGYSFRTREGKLEKLSTQQCFC